MCIFCRRKKGTDEPLTERELDVLRMLMTGEPQKIIALSFGVTTKTIKAHLQSIYAKLGAHSRTEAVVVALQRELIQLPEVLSHE